MKFPLYKDERGSFQELAHSDDVKFGQLSLLAVNPRYTRGGHYHTRKKEWFCCIRGACRMEMVNINDGTKREVILNEENREFVLIKPYESHTVTNPSEFGECVLLVIVSEKYNPNDADTFKYE